MSRPVLILSLCFAAALGVAVDLGWQLHVARAAQVASDDAGAFQRAAPALGLAESREGTRAMRRLADDAAKGAGAPDLRGFEREHKAHVVGVTTAKGSRGQTVPGVGKVNFSSPIPSATESDRLKINQPNPAPYSWHSLDGRFALTVPDALRPGGETFVADQHYRLSAVILQQDNGTARTEQVTLTEVDAAGKVIGPVDLTDVRFDYVPAKAPPELLNHLYLGIGGHVGTDGIAPLYAVGYSRRVWRFTVGLQVQVERPTALRPVMGLDGLATVGVVW